MHALAYLTQYPCEGEYHPPFTDGKTKAERKVNAEPGLLPKSVYGESTLEGTNFL